VAESLQLVLYIVKQESVGGATASVFNLLEPGSLLKPSPDLLPGDFKTGAVLLALERVLASHAHNFF